MGARELSGSEALHCGLALTGDEVVERRCREISGVLGRGRSSTEVLPAGAGGPGNTGSAAKAGKIFGAGGREANRRDELPPCGA